MAFDSDANLIINTGTADNIGATIGTDFVNDQHHQLFKLGFGASAEFQRVGDGSNVNTAPFPTRLYQSGTGTAIGSTSISGTHALDVNIQGVNGTNSSNLPVSIQAGKTGTNSLQIQGASSGYPIAITAASAIPVTVSGGISTTIDSSTVLGVTNSSAGALYVQPASGVTFAVSGNLSASVDQIGGGTLSVQGFTGMTPVAITGDVVATLSGGGVDITSVSSGVTVGVVATDLDIRGITHTTDSIRVFGSDGGDGVPTVLGYEVGGAFTAFGRSGDSLNVNIAGLSSLEVTADISGLTDLTVNNTTTNAVPVQGGTAGSLPIVISGTAGSVTAIEVTFGANVPSVEISSLPSIGGTVSIDNQIEISGGTIGIGTIGSGNINISGGTASVQGFTGMTPVAITGDVVATLSGGGVDINDASGATIGVIATDLDIRGITASSDSIVAYGSGVTGTTSGLVSYMTGFSGDWDTGVIDLNSVRHIGVQTSGDAGAAMVYVVNPLSFEGSLDISSTTLSVEIAANQVVGVTNDSSSALWVYATGGTLNVGNTVDIRPLESSVDSVTVVGSTTSQTSVSNALGTFVMGFSSGATTDLISAISAGVSSGIGFHLGEIAGAIPTNVPTTTDFQNLVTALGGIADPTIDDLAAYLKSVLSADPGTAPAFNSKNLNTTVKSISLPTTGHQKTYNLTTSDTSQTTTLDTFSCTRGVRIKAESGTDASGIRVGFAAGARDAQTSAVSSTNGFLLNDGEEIFLEVDNTNQIEIFRCGDTANVTVIAT